MAINPPGRHRVPGRFNPLAELRLLAKESAQPAVKGAAIVAASGGLIATIAPSANAAEGSALAAAPAANAPAAVGPKAAPAQASSALSSIGFVAAPTSKAASPKASGPRLIEDIVVKQQRAKAAAALKARKAAEARAARSLSRQTLTNSTSTTKTTSNTYATAGKRSSYNWATEGQCTWGALAKWKASEGYYPGGWTGNAMVWDTGAASAGYTVSGTPRTRSILVMEPGVHGSSSVGHVAWVTGVSGDKVTIIEMNALAGPYNYNTRTLTDQSGMKYIYAP